MPAPVTLMKLVIGLLVPVATACAQCSSVQAQSSLTAWDGNVELGYRGATIKVPLSTLWAFLQNKYDSIMRPVVTQIEIKRGVFKRACDGRDQVKLNRLDESAFIFSFDGKGQAREGFEYLVSDVPPAPSDVVINLPEGGGPDNMPISFDIKYSFDTLTDIAGFEVWQLPVGITAITVKGHEWKTIERGDITEAATKSEAAKIKSGTNTPIEVLLPNSYFRNNYPYHFCIAKVRNVTSISITVSKAFSTCGGFAIARLYPLDGSYKRITSKAQYECLKGCN